jgi:hypothetical protein
MRRLALLAFAAALAASPALAEPDITGAWGRLFQRPGEPPIDPKLLAPPAPEPKLKPALAVQYQALRKAQRESDERGEPLGNPSTVCLPDGMPQMMFAIYPLEILQTKGQVTIIEEAYSQVRRIFLDKPQTPIEDTPPGYFGRSVGHWDGDTLVVDTVGIKETVRGYRDAPHSDQMRIREKIRLVAPDVLHDEVTIEDPKVLEAPWTFTFAYKRMPGYEMLEYVCENNRSYLDENGVTRIRLGDK